MRDKINSTLLHVRGQLLTLYMDTYIVPTTTSTPTVPFTLFVPIFHNRVGINPYFLPA